MMKASIVVSDPEGLVNRLFAPEDKVLSNNRASYSLKRENDSTVIVIEALDAVALRAALNGVAKLLIVFEKTKKLINHD